MAEWVYFTERLPSQADADASGQVQFLESNGSMRAGLWNWIQPAHPQARDLWRINGFVAWRRIAGVADAEQPRKETPRS